MHYEKTKLHQFSENIRLSLLIALLLLVYMAPAFGQKVEAVSNMKKVIMGQDLGMYLDWDTVATTHLFGIGPLGRIAGEVTIVDGERWTASVKKNGRIQMQRNKKARGPFGVFAHVPAWDTIQLDANIQSEEDLQKLLESVAPNKGISLQTAFPYRVLATFDSIHFHIISKPSDEAAHSHELHKKAKKHFYSTQIQGELLGFYSQQHEGIFTHRGSYTHTHFLAQDRKAMGHLDGISVEGNILILLPKIAPSPTIQVNDTDFSKGSLGNIQAVDLSDLSRFHGHLCDGLVEGFLALQLGLKQLYPDGPVDRTNLRIVSKSSPCLADAAIYLTGARWQYGTFYVDNTIEGLYVLQQIDSGRSISIRRNAGVKPAIIDEMGQQAIQRQLSPCQLSELRALEDAYAAQLLRQAPETLFHREPLENFDWNPVLKNDYLKTDLLNKDQAKCSQQQ